MSCPEASVATVPAGGEVVASGRAMATAVHVRLPVPDGTGAAGRAALEEAARRALAVFATVEAACTRFDPASPLMRANRSPRRWHRAPPVLLAAVAEAKRAYDRTGGRVDPRVLRALVALGYDRTLPFGSEQVRIRRAGRAGPAGLEGPFRPRVRRGRGELMLGPEPIDLGGIGKGLAVRWAGERLSGSTGDYLVEAGGDAYCGGEAPGGGPWLVGVEDPTGNDSPVAVLALSGLAVATSSTRVRRWFAGGVPVHHLVDPRTGRPGGDGLVSVTVVGADPAMAEIWSKALFLAGRRGVAALADRRRLPALWVDDRGRLDGSATIERHLRWLRS